MSLTTAKSNAVAQWSLDEASGTRADSIGSEDLAESLFTVGSATGKFDTAADFEASTVFNYLERSDSGSSALSVSDIDFCVWIWFKIESVPGTMTLICKGSSAVDSHEYALFIFGDAVYFRVQNGATSVNQGSGLDDGEWHLAMGFHDSANNLIGVSVDGAAFTTTSYSGGVTDSAATFIMGGDSGGSRGFDGLLDDAGLIKSYVFTDADATELWNGSAGVAFANWDSSAYQPPTAAFCRNTNLLVRCVA